MKKVVGYCLCLMMLIGFSSLVHAQTFEGALTYEKSDLTFNFGNNDFFAGNQIQLKGNQHSERIFVAGNEVSLNSVELDSLFVAGNSIQIQVETSVATSFIAGNQVTIDGVFGKLNLGGRFVRVNGAIDELNVSGNNIMLGGMYDAVNAVGDVVTLTGEVNETNIAGDCVVIDGVVRGDLNIVAREVRFGPNAKVLGEVRIEKAANQQILGNIDPNDIVYVNNHHHELYWGWNQVTSFALKLINLFVLFVVTIFFVKFDSGLLNRIEAQFFEKPWLPFTLGLLGLVFMPVMMVLSAVTIVGLPITIILAVAYGGRLYLAPVISGTFIGRRSKVCNNPYGLACFGVLVIQMCTYAPFFGWIVGLTSAIFSVGSFMSLWIVKK